jgi:hypothetical protein
MNDAGTWIIENDVVISKLWIQTVVSDLIPGDEISDSLKNKYIFKSLNSFIPLLKINQTPQSHKKLIPNQIMEVKNYDRLNELT